MSNTTPNTDTVAVLAYQYWEAEGRPDGKDMEHWLKAERALNAPAQPAKTVQLKGTPKVATRRRA